MGETTVSGRIEVLLGRQAAGDPAVRDELFAIGYERLLHLTRKMLGDFPRLRAFEQSGDVLQATLKGCIGCHGDRHTETFEKWKLGLELVQTDAEQAYASAQKLLDESKDIPAETRSKAEELMSAAKADLLLIQRGNGLHNVTYAMEVLDSVTQRAQQATALLSQANSPP